MSPPIWDSGAYVETASERDNRIRLHISYQHANNERIIETETNEVVPALTYFWLGSSYKATILNSTQSDVGTSSNTSVVFSETTIFQTEIAYWDTITNPGEYKVDYNTGRVWTISTPSGTGTVTYKWSPIAKYRTVNPYGLDPDLWNPHNLAFGIGVT